MYLFHHRCGGPAVDIDRFGEGVCDAACPGDESFVCGGNLAYTAYEVGEKDFSLSLSTEQCVAFFC